MLSGNNIRSWPTAVKQLLQRARATKLIAYKLQSIYFLNIKSEPAGYWFLKILLNVVAFAGVVWSLGDPLQSAEVS